MGLLLYPYFLPAFWYRDFFLSCVKKSYQVFIYASNLLSVPLLLKTFFKPLKNEYHEGLVLFSIVFGIIVKTILLIISFLILFFLLIILFGLNILVLTLPIFLIQIVFL